MTMDLKNAYQERYTKALKPVERTLESFVQDHLSHCSRIDRITARVKEVKSFLEKADSQENGKRKYSDPFNQIQDQIGVRVVTFYLMDVEHISKEVERYFTPIERQDVVPDTDNEFGYFGKHFVLLIPKDVITDATQEALLPKFFELQVITLYQHAWAQANHDLAYKPQQMLSTDQKRRIAFTAAQSWGADMIFEELVRSLGTE